MWNRFFGLMNLVYDYGEDTKKNARKIEDIEDKVQNLNDGMTRMAYEIQRLHDETE
jgi:hypothetical protein